MVFSQEIVNENITIYSLVSPEENLGWKLELFEIKEKLVTHYHKIQKQFILVTEGSLQISYADKGLTCLKSGEMAVIEPGVPHSLLPEGRVQFLALDIPGFHFPEDVFYDVPEEVEKWSYSSEFLASFSSKFNQMEITKEGYKVYELVTGEATKEKWSVALLEINDSPRHFHKIEKELFIVAGGVLDIEIDQQHYRLEVGEFIALTPEKIHQLKSANEYPVRVLCFSFPAFNPADMHFAKPYLN